MFVEILEMKCCNDQIMYDVALKQSIGIKLPQIAQIVDDMNAKYGYHVKYSISKINGSVLQAIFIKNVPIQFIIGLTDYHKPVAFKLSNFQASPYYRATYFYLDKLGTIY